jgi:nucleotide-binding universal stress UspA family protein
MATPQEETTTLAALWQNILVPVDFSAPSEAALTYALKLASASGAQVHVCHVIPTPHVLDALYEHGLTQSESVKRIEQKARQRIKEIAASLSDTSKIHIHFSEDEATAGVLAWETKLKPDLIVIGTHGRQGAKRFFMGSVAEAVVRRASCPVLTLRG